MVKTRVKGSLAYARISYISIKGKGEVQKLPKFGNSSTDKLREMQTKGGGLKSRKFCERNKWIVPNRPYYWQNATSESSFSF